jgi:uncharacterized membrane-anchored protein YhcB (DUF1043 family)
VNGETFLWVLVYAVVGLVVLGLVAALIVGAVQSVQAKGKFSVTLDAPELSGYGGEVHGHFDTEGQLVAFLQRYAQDVIRWTESPDRKGPRP